MGAALREYMRRARVRRDIRATMFAQQLAFAEDLSKRVAASCSRRGGKTVALSKLIVETLAMAPRRLVAYITDTRGHAMDLIWQPLKDEADRQGLRYTANETRLQLTLANGSKVMLAGAEKEKDIGKLRGFAYDLVCIDEAQNIAGHMMRLIDDVLEMALLDRDGRLVLTGTPNASCAGEFHDICTRAKDAEGKALRPGWSVHHWTLLDNPHLPHAAEYLERLRADKGWGEDHPTYRREALGEWVRDDTALVYRYRRELNWIDAAPDGVTWTYLLGADLGFDDATGFVVWGWSPEIPELVALHAEKHQGWNTTQIGRRAQELVGEWGGFAAQVMDTGGLGKMVAEEINQRYAGCQFIPAVKVEKWAHIELLNGDLESGRVKVAPGAKALAEEWELLLKDTSKDVPIEDPRFDNHLADAALYAWRYGRQYCWTPEAPQPKQGTADWINEQARLEEQREAEALERELRGDDLWRM